MLRTSCTYNIKYNYFIIGFVTVYYTLDILLLSYMFFYVQFHCKGLCNTNKAYFILFYCNDSPPLPHQILAQSLKNLLTYVLYFCIFQGQSAVADIINLVVFFCFWKQNKPTSCEIGILPEEEVVSWSLSPSLLSSADPVGPAKPELVGRCCLRRLRDLCDRNVFWSKNSLAPFFTDGPVMENMRNIQIWQVLQRTEGMDFVVGLQVSYL